MEPIDKWAERIYGENDFGRGIATSITGVVGLSAYLITNDWVIATFGSMISFPIVRIISTSLHEKSKRSFAQKTAINETEILFQSLSSAEKSVVQAFVKAGGTALTYSDINQLDLSSAAIEALIQREVLWTSVTADGMRETFVIDVSFFDAARNTQYDNAD